MPAARAHAGERSPGPRKRADLVDIVEGLARQLSGVGKPHQPRDAGLFFERVLGSDDWIGAVSREARTASRNQ